ncbi:MAG: zinc transporter ZupT, partial [Chitinophagaceae bacterium]
MNQEHLLLAFGLTLFAGLSTGIGGLIAFSSKKFKPGFLSAALGFSAGVMLYVSFIEIFPKSISALEESYSEKGAYIFAVLSFFVGIALIALIDKMIPKPENPHEVHFLGKIDTIDDDIEKAKLYRLGLLSALAITIHNFPEGLVTFFATLQDPSLGVSLSIAIAIHNIPEGVAVAVPIYYATKSKTKALLFSFLSGLAEPIGALIGYLLLFNIFDDKMFGYIFAGISGIMVFIALDQLLPMAHRYGKHHNAIYGLISGMAVMA